MKPVTSKEALKLKLLLTAQVPALRLQTISLAQDPRPRKNSFALEAARAQPLSTFSRACSCAQQMLRCELSQAQALEDMLLSWKWLAKGQDERAYKR